MPANAGISSEFLPSNYQPIPESSLDLSPYEQTGRIVEELAPQPAPFTWNELQGDSAYNRLEGPGQFRLKRRYFDDFIADTGKTWDEFEDETSPSMGERFVGSAYGVLGSLQETASVAAGALGYEDVKVSLAAKAKANEKYAARRAYVSKYGESGWGQIENMSDGGWWTALLAEMGPQSAPFLAGMGAGAAAGMWAGPVGVLVGAIIGGGGAAMFQEYGGAYNEFLETNPGDTEGANEYAWIKSGVAGTVNAASVPLGLVGGGATAPLKHFLSQIVVQGAMGGADAVTGNLVRRDLLDSSQPLSEGLAKAVLGEGIFEAPGVMGAARASRRLRMAQAKPETGAIEATELLGVEDAPNVGPVDNTQIIVEDAPVVGPEPVEVEDAPNLGPEDVAAVPTPEAPAEVVRDSAVVEPAPEVSLEAVAPPAMQQEVPPPVPPAAGVSAVEEVPLGAQVEAQPVVAPEEIDASIETPMSDFAPSIEVPKQDIVSPEPSAEQGVTAVDDTISEEPAVLSTAAPRPPVPAPPGTTGTTGEVITGQDQEVEFQWRVVELGDLLTSHDAEGRKNPAYPEAMQPRQRERVAMQAQVDEIAAKLDPQQLGENRRADSGAPIVSSDLVVESGNGRTIALSKAYKGERGQAYREWLQGTAEGLGLDPGVLAGMNQPVLVRERTTEMSTEERAEFARQANAATAARLGPAEQAAVDAERLPDMRLFQPAEDGSISNEANKDFVRAFVGKTVDASERGEMLTGEGHLTPDGAQRIRRAVFAKAYGNPDLTALLTEAPDDASRNVTNALFRAAARMAKLREGAEKGALNDRDISADVATAALEYGALRKEGMRVEMARRQESLTGPRWSPFTLSIMEMFEKHRRSSVRIAKILTNYVDSVEGYGAPGQADLLRAPEVPTSEKLLDDAVAKAEGTLGQETFGLESRGKTEARKGIDLPRLQREAQRLLGSRAPELRVVDRLFNSAGQAIPGDYAAKVVRLAEWAADPGRTLHHELFHAAYDLFTPAQQQMLDKQMGADGARGKQVAAALRSEGLDEAADHALSDPREAAAYAFEMYAQKRQKFTGPVRHAFDRLQAMLRRIVRAFTGKGQHSVDAMFDALWGERMTDLLETPPTGVSRESRGAVRKPAQVEIGKEMPTGPRKLTDKLFNIPFRLIPVNKAYGYAMDWAVDNLPERFKAGVFDRWGETEWFKGLRLAFRHRKMENIRYLRKTAEGLIANFEDRQMSRVAYEWMTTNNAASETELINQLNPEQAATIAHLKQVIHQLGQEAVDLGLVTKDAFDRNAMAYLRRSYMKHELTEDGAIGKQRSRSIKVLGDNLKGRGLKDDYSLDRLGGNLGETLGTAEKLIGRKFVRVEQRTETGRLRTYAYVATGEPIPSKYANWTVDADADGDPNVWEARWKGKSAKTIRMWRDLAKPERETLGEIDEVKYATMRTMASMLHDIEAAKFFQHISRNTDHAVADSGDIPEGHTAVSSAGQRTAYLPTEWVQVPRSDIIGTKVKTYGDLAGMWVAGPVWNEVRAIGQWDSVQRWKWWADLIRAFKVSKTALSPTTHVNNTLSNLLFAEWADVRASSVTGALHTYIKAWGGDAAAKEKLDDFVHSGAGYGTFAEQELREEVLEPLRKALEEEAGRQGVDFADGHPLSGARAFALADAIIQGLKAVKDVSVDLYQLEDNVFRLAAYQQGMAEGLTTEEAAARATDAFLDYDINAPWVNVARQSYLPFIAFSYRAIPKLHQLVKDKPYKLLKLGLVMGALNAASYAFIGADEEEERRLLPEQRRGKVFGMFPRLMRMPWNKNGHPVFLDIVRWIPAGDLFLWGETNTAIPIPPSLVPGGPMEWGVELIANKDLYTGKPITKDTDTPYEMGKAVALHLWKGIAPNAAIIPGSYTYDKIFPGLPEGAKTGLRAVGLGSTTPTMDVFGREYPALLSALNTFGFKIAVFPKDTAILRLTQQADAKIKTLQREMAMAGNNHMRGGMNRAAFEAKIKHNLGKIEKIARELQTRLHGEPK